MLAPTMLLMMFEYNHKTNNRLLDGAADVTPEQWDGGQEADQSSLHETLFHILAVEEEWLVLCQSGQSPAWSGVSIQRYPDAASLRAFSDHVYATYLPYIESLTEGQLSLKASGLFPSGRMESVSIWHILVHALYHSAQHRSEVASILTRYGHSPSFIDFYGFGDWGED